MTIEQIVDASEDARGTHALSLSRLDVDEVTRPHGAPILLGLASAS